MRASLKHQGLSSLVLVLSTFIHKLDSGPSGAKKPLVQKNTPTRLRAHRYDGLRLVTRAFNRKAC